MILSFLKDMVLLAGKGQGALLANMSKYVQDAVMSACCGQGFAGFSPLTGLSQEQGTLESHRGSRFCL